jgi:hypothetical protein
MALPSNTGTLDIDANLVLPNNTGLWSELSTWDTFNSWIMTPANPLIYLSELVDLGEVRDFCLKIQTEAVGTVAYTVYTSTTGAFAGEEASVDIAQGATGVASFTARYYIVAVKVTQTSGLNVLNSFELTVTAQLINIDLNAVDTSTLAGTSSARTLALPRSVGKIFDLQVTPWETTAYNVDFYVSNTATSTTLIPRIVNKSGNYIQDSYFDTIGYFEYSYTPVIALVGIDNVARDGVVDVFIRCLPEMYMSGNNLLVR